MRKEARKGVQRNRDALQMLGVADSMKCLGQVVLPVRLEPNSHISSRTRRRAAMVLPRLSNGVAASAAWPCRPDHARRVCELFVLPLTCCQRSG